MKNRLSIGRFGPTFLLILLMAWMPSMLAQSSKINGISFNGPEHPVLEQEMVSSVAVAGANWIAFVPEATLERNTLRLRSDAENHWWGERIEGSIEGIKKAHAAGLKVMLKPHIVLSEPEGNTQKMLINFGLSTGEDKTGGASWRGSFAPRNEADWQVWEAQYEAYILALAQVADSLQIGLFCIGTELKKSTTTRPQFWQQLIQKVRAIYSGPLTYSANWDEYDRITFWDDLDYIGVDAYFPVSWMETPTVRNTIKNWRPIVKKLKKISKVYQRPILITEVGYRNVSYAGKKPWRHDDGGVASNDKAQANLYEAFFRALHKKSWVAGSFIWEWFALPKEKGNTSFSPQGKRALKVLESFYEKDGVKKK